MKYVFTIILIALVVTGLSNCNYGLKQSDCMKEERFLYKGNCVKWQSIPYEDREDVIYQIADEIAEEKGITQEQALDQMLELVEYYGQ